MTTGPETSQTPEYPDLDFWKEVQAAADKAAEAVDVKYGKILDRWGLEARRGAVVVQVMRDKLEEWRAKREGETKCGRTT